MSFVTESKRDLEGGRAKFISKAFLLPRQGLEDIARGKGIKNYDTLTVYGLLEATKLVPTHAQIKEYATKWQIPVRRGDGKEKIIMLIRRYEFLHAYPRK